MHNEKNKTEATIKVANAEEETVLVLRVGSWHERGTAEREAEVKSIAERVVGLVTEHASRLPAGDRTDGWWILIQSGNDFLLVHELFVLLSERLKAPSPRTTGGAMARDPHYNPLSKLQTRHSGSSSDAK